MTFSDKIKLVEEHLNGGHFNINLEDNLISCSKGFLNIVEATSGESLTYEEWISFFYKSDHDDITESLERVKNGNAVEKELLRTVTENGKKPITLKLKPIFEEGAIRSVFGIIQCTPHRRNEGNTFKHNHPNLEHITDTIPGVVYRLKVTPDKEQSFEFISGRCKQLLGVESEALLQDFNLVWKIIHPDDRKIMYNSLDDLIKNRGSWRNEFRILTEDDTYKWILGKADFDEVRPDGSMLWSGVLLDVTDRKFLEEELQRKNHLLEHAQELSTMGFWNWKLEENTVEWSDQLYHIYGLDKDSFESNFEGYLSHVHPDDRESTRSLILDALDHKKDFSFEERIIRRDGEIRYLQTWGDTILDEDGDVAEMFGACIDITELKSAEQKLRESLREKEVLLQEVHHRVKNNLQLITGLIDLQINNTVQKKVREKLEDNKLRIFSIAKVHEAFLQKGSFANIQFNEYLSELITNISQSVQVEECNIGLQVDLEETVLNVNQAIPCGLLLNELLINAYQHAFPDDSGEIKVKLAESNETFQLSIEDNGTGIPDEVDPENPQTLGFLLVKTLIDQLEAELTEFKRKAGTRFTITFKKGAVRGSSSNLGA